ncbi:hypothetical protein ACFX2I_007613 [Malus domestica]
METQSENQAIEPINLDQELDLSESSFDDTGRKRKRTSVVWQHFEEKCFCGEVKAICNHCKARLASGSTVGTSSLLSHVRTCPVLKTKKKSPVITSDGSVKHGVYSFDEGNAPSEIEKVFDLAVKLVKEYELKHRPGHWSFESSSSTDFSSQSFDFRVGDPLTSYDQFVMDSTIGNEQSNIDLYLGEKVLPRTQDFDILSWWKTNGIKYPILHQIA